jgi:DNA-binding transcriptional MerR regulator
VDKAPEAFRTISEVAAELEIPQHVLRFWESRFHEIRPLKRGGGRRYYRPQDIDLLRGIRHLLYNEGYTVRGVQRILREQGDPFVRTVWQPGAPQPPRGLVEEEPASGAERSERSDAPGALPRDREDVRVQDSAALSPQHGRQLQEALNELLACRRLLDGAADD